MRAFAQLCGGPRSRPMPGMVMEVLAVGLVITAASVFCAPPVKAQSAYEQVIQFRPGWNAIYLEVQPDPAQIADVFSPGNCGVPMVPLLSVWTFDPRYGSVGTIADPAQGLFTTTGWFGFFPDDRSESVLNNLFALIPHRAYLVKMGGTQPITCAVPGVPVLRSVQWVADSFNLVGLRVDPANPPTLQSYFAPSEAHTGQSIYRLDPGGAWQPVLPFVETARAGEAYWVYTRGPSTYQGPLEIELEAGDRLDYGGSLTQDFITFHNRLDVDTLVTLRRLPAPAPVPLKYRGFNEATDQTSWPVLPNGFTIAVPAESSALLDVAVSRARLTGRSEQILEATNEFGARVLLQVVASPTRSTNTGSGSSSFTKSVSRPASPETAPPNDFAGLWVGRARVSRVSEILCVLKNRDCTCRDPGSCDVDGQPCVDDLDCGPVSDLCAAGACTSSGAACSVDRDCPGFSQNCVQDLIDPGDAFECDPDCDNGQICTCNARECESPTAESDPQPTGDEFPIRLLVHVDRSGQPRLLKEVIQLFKEQVLGPDPATPGFQTLIDPGSYVLITNDDLIPEFSGVAMRDGKPVGMRISTAAYDFDETTPGWDAESHALRMAGQFTTSGVVSASIEMGKNFPTNPFRHRYHPDHNNLDNQFLPMVNVCGLTEFSCSSDDDCHFAIPTGTAACLLSGESCSSDDDCFWPIPDGSSRVCLGDGTVCIGPADCGDEGPCLSGEGVCEGTLDRCSNDGNCPDSRCVQVVETGGCQPVDAGLSICLTTLETCSNDADCQQQICEDNGAACTTEESCLEIDILAAVSICEGDPAISCDSTADCAGDGPCVVRQVCDLDRTLQCADDTGCVEVPPTDGGGNHRVCDGNVLRACATDVDCSGVGISGVTFDDGICVNAQDDGPCLPVTDHGPCADRYDDIALDNPCVAGADLGRCEERAEAPAVTRTIVLDFRAQLESFCTQGCDGPNDPNDPLPRGCVCEPPEWGSNQIGGTYTETVVGLHRVPIVAEGEFVLRRVADTPVLNREP